MTVDFLRKYLEEIGFKFIGVTFMEDGYEAGFRLQELDFEDEEELNKYVEESSDRICKIIIPGFVISEVIIDGSIYLLTLVPKSLEEMTDFIWKYVEKYGRREDRLVDILRDAFCALEKAIDSIPNEDNEKETAKSNFDRFASMIF